MKRADVRFKCVVPDKKTLNEILSLCSDDFKEENRSYLFLAFEGLRGTAQDIRSTTNHADVFCQWDEPLMSWQDALKLLESCEENQKKSGGEWVEYDVFYSERHKEYIFDTGGSTFSWQNHLLAEIELKMIFGGWRFAGFDNEWLKTRMGLDKLGTTTSYVKTWARPAIPSKIRFWKENK